MGFGHSDRFEMGPSIEREEAHRRFSPMFQDDSQAVRVMNANIEGVLDSAG
jgi:hypothetical protein